MPWTKDDNPCKAHKAPIYKKVQKNWVKNHLNTRNRAHSQPRWSGPNQTSFGRPKLQVTTHPQNSPHRTRVAESWFSFFVTHTKFCPFLQTSWIQGISPTFLSMFLPYNEFNYLLYWSSCWNWLSCELSVVFQVYIFVIRMWCKYNLFYQSIEKKIEENTSSH